MGGGKGRRGKVRRGKGRNGRGGGKGRSGKGRRGKGGRKGSKYLQHCGIENHFRGIDKRVPIFKIILARDGVISGLSASAL